MVNIDGSCNGLVLASPHDLHWVGKFVIVNLITRDYVEFLMFRHEWSRIIKHDSMILGFGYDSVTDDYKVVSIYRYQYLLPPYELFVHVYTLGSNTLLPKLPRMVIYKSSRANLLALIIY